VNVTFFFFFLSKNKEVINESKNNSPLGKVFLKQEKDLLVVFEVGLL
jgi:hypothetical protein